MTIRHHYISECRVGRFATIIVYSHQPPLCRILPVIYKMSLTFYTNYCCPYAQRVQLALAATGTKAEVVEIDLNNKPEW